MEQEVPNSFSAFFTRKHPQKEKQFLGASNGRSDIKFYKFQKIGHFRNKCPEWQNNKYAMNLFLNGDFQKYKWYIDSGTSIHLTANRSWMKNEHILETTEVVVTDKSNVRANFASVVEIDNEQLTSIDVKDVLFIPE